MNISHEIKHIGWAGWARIGIAVLLIIGAYIAGVLAGTSHDDSGRYSKTWGDMRHMMRGDYGKERADMTTHDPMQMSMADMGTMLEGKNGDELNKAFLEGMIPHHQWAIEMAKYLASSNKPELVKLGGEIIAAQSKEIDQMKAWLIEWWYTNTWVTQWGWDETIDPMLEHCQMMPDMAGCEKYR